MNVLVLFLQNIFILSASNNRTMASAPKTCELVKPLEASRPYKQRITYPRVLVSKINIHI